MSRIINEQIGSCRVWANLDDRFVRTTFADGMTLDAIPHDTEEYLATARSVGYDTVDMLNHEHDPLHALVALWLGMDHSPVLYSTAKVNAGTGKFMPKLAYEWEDRLALDFALYLNTGEKRPTLGALLWRGHKLTDLRDEARRILGRES